MLLSRPGGSTSIFPNFPIPSFCNNHTNKPIILIATCTMIYSSLMRSTRQYISSFRPLPNNMQINAVTVIPFRCSNHIFYFSPFYRVHLSCFCNHRSVVLYCQTPSMLICHFCEVPVYTLKGRRRVYVVETVYIIHFQPHLRRHYKQIM